MNDATASAQGVVVVRDMLSRLQAARAELRAIEESEHHPITDKFGRVWTWWKGDLYRHDNMAWPESFFDNPDNYGLPKPSALKYYPDEFCDICRVSQSRPVRAHP